MSDIKLLPCPFCGGEAIQEAGERAVWYDEYEYFECVHCTNCKASVEAETVEEAVTKWNARKPMERIIERLEEKLSDTNFEKATQECNESYVDGLSMGYAGAIGICKEEGGIE